MNTGPPYLQILSSLGIIDKLKEQRSSGRRALFTIIRTHFSCGSQA